MGCFVMKLTERLTTYILKTAPVTLDTLIAKATEQGYTELEVLTALDSVSRDKRIVSTANTAGIVTYKLASVKERVDPAAYIREHYPTMDATNDGSGIEANFDYLFLSPSEMKEYKAAAKGVPTHMLQSNKYGRRS